MEFVSRVWLEGRIEVDILFLFLMVCLANYANVVLICPKVRIDREHVDIDDYSAPGAGHGFELRRSGKLGIVGALVRKL